MAPRRNQTVKPRWFHILLALSDQDRHGSDIVREVESQTGGDLKLWPAMLYRSLDQLAEQGLIDELTDPEVRPAGVSGKRRYFRITDHGRGVLVTEADRFAALARLARTKNVPTREHAS